MVVLDEPNSNLDAAGEQALTDTLLRAKQMGVTIVVITQRPALLNIVDKVLILRGGRVEAFGPPQRGAASPAEPQRRGRLRSRRRCRTARQSAAAAAPAE